MLESELRIKGKLASLSSRIGIIRQKPSQWTSSRGDGFSYAASTDKQRHGQADNLDTIEVARSALRKLQTGLKDAKRHLSQKT